MVAATVSMRLRRSTRTHDAYRYKVRAAGAGRRGFLAMVTSSPSVARRWVHTTLWRGHHRLRHGKPLTVGMGVQWTPPFRRPSTLQLCCGHRCLVFQIAQAGGGIPNALRRFLRDYPSVEFVGYNVLADCLMLSEHYGLVVSRATELRVLTGMGRASMEGMAERLLGWSVSKSRKVAMSNWNRRKLSKAQVTYACLDANLSFCLGVHARRTRQSVLTAMAAGSD
ncbi:uncharacterized protein LOC104583597 [Brachypodium distachyon]|uniref:3'-5' exonuclease domain-containing protein n=1 Tax=Brachypodium distachyon TaxID=15368 RepID=I1I2Q6_BRADI|nr:uncharacterized protein LOC104583597 [Brachypodium distachyon]KQJ96003.1 hypothetical protein BRADI_3g20160v3 [Brachypodium distachyon]|eukprot:XP_010234569.1 uncharacterized protein LOC104583597 [Brachypodium distachyon]